MKRVMNEEHQWKWRTGDIAAGGRVTRVITMDDRGSLRLEV